MKMEERTLHLTTDNEPLMKVCSRCERSLPFSAFYRNKSKRDGVESYCKECAKHRNLLKRIKNKKVDPFSGDFTVVFNGLPEEKAFISKLETIIEEVIE
jgi:hypothetical protein